MRAEHTSSASASSSVPSSASSSAGTGARPGHATGPRTAEGKRRSSLNAVKHGLYSSQIIIFPEEQRFFCQWRRNLLREIAPADQREVDFFERIVSLRWKLRRAELAEPQLCPPEPYPRLDEEDERELRIMSAPRRREFLNDLEADRREYWERVQNQVSEQYVEQLTSVVYLQTHQIRIGNALNRVYRELDNYRRSLLPLAVQCRKTQRSDSAMAELVEHQAQRRQLAESIAADLEAQWARELHTARQRRWRQQKRARRREETICRRLGTLLEKPRPATEVQTQPSPPPQPPKRGGLQPLTRKILAQAVETARARGIPVSIDLDKLEHHNPQVFNHRTGQWERTYGPDDDNPVVIAPNGRPVHREVLAHVIEANPNAVELKPRPPQSGHQHR